jgi:hypothetical protein
VGHELLKSNLVCCLSLYQGFGTEEIKWELVYKEWPSAHVVCMDSL